MFSKIKVFLKWMIKKYLVNGRLAILFLSTESALHRIVNRGLEIKSVIDVGASDGRWSVATSKMIPPASFMLIEAQEEHSNDLHRLKRKRINFDFVIAAVGNSEGEIYFDKSDLFGGLASETKKNEKFVSVPITKVDSIVENYKLEGPFLLKLDTHGYEVPIFEGALNTLKETNLIVVETYNFKLTEDSLRFHEMVFYLEEKGFRCIDISEPLFRKRDLSFWQIDMFFIPDNRKEFEVNSYE